MNLKEEFEKEQKRYKFQANALRTWGYSNLILFLILLFSIKGLGNEFYLLNLYAILSNISVFLIFSYYKIPTLFRNLLSPNDTIVEESYQIIDSNREVYVRHLLFELDGKNLSESKLGLNLVELRDLINEYLETDWKKVGRIYFSFYFIITIGLYYYLIKSILPYFE